MNIIDISTKIIREKIASDFLNNQPLNAEQKNKAIRILVDFQKFLDKQEAELD